MKHQLLLTESQLSPSNHGVHGVLKDETAKAEHDDCFDEFTEMLNDFIVQESEANNSLTEDEETYEDDENYDDEETCDDDENYEDDEETCDDEEEFDEELYEARRKEILEVEAELIADHLEESLKFLDDMVGMEHVKQKLLRLGRYAQWKKHLEIAGIDTSVFPQPNLTFMFLGSPGTGKTTVAKEMGKILKSIELLTDDSVYEFRREDLVGQNYGCEEENTKEALRQSNGGVFFLDEAYQCFKQSTDKRDPAYHILETMMQHFDKPNRCIIMAGYKDEMHELFKVNPGFRSRIPEENIIEFTGPSEQMLVDVATKAFDRMSLNMTQDADAMLRQHIHDIWVNKDKDFGNARVIRQLAESIVINHANRVMTTAGYDDLTINEADIRHSVSRQQPKTAPRPHVGFV